MKQTAVDWLHEEYMRIYKDNNISVFEAFEILDKYNQAKEMEKEQMYDAYKEGYVYFPSIENFNEYYKENYKSNETKSSQ